jgi:hypothetical protein
MARFVNFWLLASNFWLWSLRFSAGSYRSGVTGSMGTAVPGGVGAGAGAPPPRPPGVGAWGGGVTLPGVAAPGAPGRAGTMVTKGESVLDEPNGLDAAGAGGAAPGCGPAGSWAGIGTTGGISSSGAPVVGIEGAGVTGGGT